MLTAKDARAQRSYRHHFKLSRPDCQDIGVNMVHKVPLVPGQVIGPQAQEPLIDHLLLSKTRAKHMPL